MHRPIHVVMSESHSAYSAAMHRLPLRVTTLMRFPEPHIYETCPHKKGGTALVKDAGFDAAGVNVVVLQSVSELEEWATHQSFHGWALLASTRCVYLEHNPPTDLPAADHPATTCRNFVDILVHVTEMNDLLWRTGRVRTVVIEHGVPVPAPQYSGAVERITVVMNEPLSRAWAVGLDIVNELRDGGIDIELIGGGTEAVGGTGYRSQDALHERMAQNRAYLHPFRWTSLGLTLIEALHMGVPVVAVGSTGVPAAIRAGEALVCYSRQELHMACTALLEDAPAAQHLGQAGLRLARTRFSLERFIHDWSALFDLLPQIDERD